jgi:predicted alpha-1,6-mannanase (GH76 family)
MQRKWPIILGARIAIGPNGRVVISVDCIRTMARGGLMREPKGPVIGIVSFLLAIHCFTPRAHAVTKGQADTAIKAFNAAYWNASNKTFYKQDNKSGQLDYWMWAHAWETEMDAYERTQDPAYLQKIKDTYTGFIAHNGTNGTNLSNNPYNDDIAWWLLAAVRAYELTLDTNYRALAKKNFDWMHSTQHDTVWGGGIWWQNRARNQKNSCSTIPMAIVGYKLAKQLNTPAYAAKALTMQNWVRKRLLRPTGELADRVIANGTGDSVVWGPLSYNHGVFIYSSYLSFLHTKDSAYFKEARATADYFKRDKCDPQGIMPDEKGTGGNTSNDAGMYKTVFVHYMMRFIIEAEQKQYLPWMNANAESLWKNRRAADNLMWFLWSTPAPTVTGAGGIGSHMATGMVSLLNLIVIAEATPVVSIGHAPQSRSRDPLPAPRGTGLTVRDGNSIYGLDGKRIHGRRAVSLPK